VGETDEKGDKLNIQGDVDVSGWVDDPQSTLWNRDDRYVTARNLILDPAL
jgi:hypothetical protein